MPNLNYTANGFPSSLEVLFRIENNHPSSEEVAGRMIDVVSFVEVDLAVGLDSQVRSVLTSEAHFSHRLLGHYEDIFRAHSENSDTTSFLGLDGVFVRLGQSWSSKYTS